MRLDGGKIKEVQVHLLLSSRAEMQKVIETARQTTIPAAAVGPQPVLSNQQNSIIKPQQSIIANNSLSGILAQQMYQQHQMQIISQQQNMPLMTSTSVRHDAYLAIQNQKQQQQLQQLQQPQQPQIQQQQQFLSMNQRQIPNENSNDSREIQGDRKYSTDRKRRDSRSRSKSRDKRDRRRSRSRGRRHRSRSRSRERRRRRTRSRDRGYSGRDRNNLNRDRSRDRGRIRNRSYEKDDRKESGNETNKPVDQQITKSSTDQFSDIGTEKNSAIWENNDSSLNQPYMGILQKFSSATVPFGSNESNKPISLFNNIYNQPANSSENNSKLNSFISPHDYLQQGSLLSPKQEQPYSSFEPVMPMIPFGGRSDPSRIDNNRDDDIDDNSDMVRCCIRVTNIGTNTHYSAVRRFFSGLHIPNDGVKLINDQYGNRTGVAVVRFLRTEVADQALRRNQQQLNGNTINITIISLQEYNAEEDSYRPPRNSYDRNRGGDFSNNRMGGYNRSFNDTSDNRFGGHNDSGIVRNYRNDNRMNDNMFTIDDTKKKDMSGPQIVDDDDDDVLYVSDSNCNREQSSTLLVEDLPQTVSDEDVQKLFAKYTVVQIILPKVTSKFHAYVKLSSAEEAQMALKDAYRIEYKPVFVSVCSEKIFESILKDNGINAEPSQKNYDNNDDMELVDEYDNDDEQNKEVAKEEKDKTHENNEKQVSINNKESINLNFSSVVGNKTNNNNETPAIPSLIDLNIRNFGGRFGSQQYNSSTRDPSNNSSSENDTKWIYLKNIEYRTVENEIGNWFADIDLRVKRIFLLRNHRGQPSGESFCEFSSTSDARSSLCKNRTRLGSRIIHLNLTQKSHVINALRSQNNIDISDDESSLNDDNDETVQDENENENSNDNENADDGDNTKNSEDAEENIVEETGDERNEDVYEDDDNKNESGEKDVIENPFRKGGGIDTNITDDDTIDEKKNKELFNTINDQKQNVSNQIIDDGNMMAQNRGGNYMIRDDRSNYRDQKGSSNMRNADNNYNNRGNMGNNGNMMGMNMNRNMGNNNMNLDGRVVSVMNVPYRANTIDILEFFSGFQLTPDDVLRRYNDVGQPTGDARVRFLTPIDARKAVESMNNKRIMNRNVNLSLL